MYNCPFRVLHCHCFTNSKFTPIKFDTYSRTQHRRTENSPMMWFCSFAHVEMGGADCSGDYDVITFLPRYYDNICDCLSENPPSLHFPVFREIPF